MTRGELGGWGGKWAETTRWTRRLPQMEERILPKAGSRGSSVFPQGKEKGQARGKALSDGEEMQGSKEKKWTCREKVWTIGKKPQDVESGGGVERKIDEGREPGVALRRKRRKGKSMLKEHILHRETQVQP